MLQGNGGVVQKVNFPYSIVFLFNALNIRRKIESSKSFSDYLYYLTFIRYLLYIIDDNIMDIDKIITEEINNFINSEILKENMPVEAKTKSGIRKNAVKLKNGLRTNFDAKLDKETNPNLNNGDAEEIANALDNDVVNVAAVARQLYPKLTNQGAQSKLRKKIKHIKSDSGTPYTLKKKEAFKARRIISHELEQ